ncbi:MAG: MaoC/PaaZ C-terminal domain-containing protein [Candidatus Binataceae bacterium]
MPVDSSMVGSTTGAIAAEVDERWSMAYAAGLGDALACYLDTRRTAGIVAHPLFPVCFEWPAATSLRAKHRASVSAAEAARGVHATQHTMIHRLVRPPERLLTTATIAGIERRKPGVYELTTFETVDAAGAAVCTTYNGTIYRQVELSGPDRPSGHLPPATLAALPARPRAELKVPVVAVAAHVYTECARIWNPIHTDAAVAARVGLPAIILHGTATLALSISRIVEEELGNDPERVAEIYGRFGAMVLMPSAITVRVLTREKLAAGETIFFETLTQEGGRAVRDGVVRLR